VDTAHKETAAKATAPLAITDRAAMLGSTALADSKAWKAVESAASKEVEVVAAPLAVVAGDKSFCE